MHSRKIPAHRSPRLAAKMSSLGKATKKVLAAASTALLVASALVLGVGAPASATEVCVPKAAWTETIIDQVYVPAVTHTAYQRYSWTKPQNQEADNPQTTPLSAPGEWQANTGNYDGAGHGTDPVGIAFDTGHPGNGDWFFWTATEVVDTPAIEEVSHTVDHPAVTCDEPPVVTPAVSFAYSTECGSLTLTTISTDVNANWYYGTKATVDGVMVGSAVQKGSGTKITVIPFDEDSYGGSVDVVVETYASTEQDLLPAGWALGVQHTVSVKTDCVTPVVNPVCEGSTTLPVSTNLNTQGWVLKPGTAEYVAGGVQLTSTNWDGGKVTLATNFPLSEAGAVAIDYTQGPGSGSVALLFNTSDGNQIHYEPFVGYTHPWFADEAGVFPLGGGGQGSDWSGSNLTDLISNPTVTSVVIGVWGAASDVVTVHSATFNCKTQNFDLAVVPETPQPKVVVTHGEFGGAAPTCEVPSVVWTRTETTTTTPYKVIVEDGQYKIVEDTENITVDTVTDEQTKTVAYEGDCPVIKPIAPEAFDAECASDEGQNDSSSSTGYIQLDLKDHLHYTIDGQPTTSAQNFLEPGTYTVAVTADEGYKVDGAASWTRTINPSFCPPTFALLSTTASMTNSTCSTQGTYTLANTEGVEWFVNGSPTPTEAGTYKVTGASTVNVEAKLINDVVDGWEEGAQTAWTFKFTDPTDCLPTLAFTGSNGSAVGLLLASGLLLTGGVVLSLDQRRRRMAKGL